MTTEEYVDISPDPAGSIRADLHREGFDYAKSFGELIDNSLDADATRIVIEINKNARRITITDNGNGCVDPHRMLRKGDSTKRARDGLGRYGVGLKHASFYIAGEDGLTTIITSYRGIHQMLQVKWGDQIKANSWKIRAPQVVSNDTVSQYLPERKGTRIMFTLGKGRGMPLIDSLLEKLEFVFSPALRSGRQIEVVGIGKKPRILSAPRDPAWSEAMTFDIEIDGKSAKVRAGIKDLEDKSRQCGLAYVYRHRVIIANSAHGCGQFNIGGIAGFVELDHSWDLGQDKSEITDSSWGLLGEKILERLSPLLEKAHNARRQMQNEALCKAISDALSTAAIENYLGLGAAKRPHKHGSKRVADSKTSNRNDVKNAMVINGSGNVRGLNKTLGGPGVELVNDPYDSRAGWVEPTSRRVFLNAAIPRIAAAQANNETDYMMLLAASIYWNYFAHRPKQRVFGEEPEQSFDGYLGVWLHTQSAVTMAQAV